MLCLAGSLSTGFLVAPTHLRSAATLRRAPAVELNLRNYVVMAAQAAAKQAAAEEADVVANAEARRFDAVPRVYDAAVAISAAMEAGKLKDAAAIQAAAHNVHTAAAKLGKDQEAFARKWTERCLRDTDDGTNNAGAREPL